MAPRLRHEPTLNQLAAFPTVALTQLWRCGELPKRVLEFLGKQFLRIAMLAPPRIFRFKLTLGLIEKDDSHGAPDTA